MIARLDQWQAENRKQEEEDKKRAKDTKEYTAYKAQRDLIYDKWKDSRYLEGYPEYQAKIVAMILDNQDLFLSDESFGTDTNFRNIGLELISKVFRGFVGFDLVNIQPILRPIGQVFYAKFKYTPSKKPSDINEYYSNPNYDLPDVNLVMESHEISAKTRKLGLFTSKVDFIDVDKLATQLRKDITKEILNDLSRNAGTVAKLKMPPIVDGEYPFYIKLISLSDIIHRKTLRQGLRWLIASPKMAKRIQAEYKYCDWNADVSEVTKIGCLNNAWNLYVDPDMIENQMLLGTYEKDQMFDCYAYCPYIQFSQLGHLIDPETSKENRPIALRYGKLLPKEGSKYYVRMEIEDEVVS